MISLRSVLVSATTKIATPTGEFAHGQFFHDLHESGLLSESEVARMEQFTAKASVEEVRNQFLNNNLLNSDQFEQLLRGKQKSLSFGSYRILEEIGKGGFGKVYKARHEIMDRIVAIKILDEDISNDEALREMFVREVILTTKLSHPAIAASYHADEIDGRIFFAMEYIEGHSLYEYVQKLGALPVDKVVSIASQSAQALQHALEIGMVHRDIKPANIMLAGTSESIQSCAAHDLKVKIIDFGLASLTKNNARIIATLKCNIGEIVGTPAFMAPEQIKNAHDADVRSDLYSLGCTLYFALTGRLPFDGKSPAMVIVKHLNEEAPPLRSLCPDVRDELAAIVAKLMEKNPDHRYQTPAELDEALWNYRIQLGSRAYASPTPRNPADENDFELGALTSDSDKSFSSADTVIAAYTLIDDEEVTFEELQTLWTVWYDLVRRCRTEQRTKDLEAEYTRTQRRLVAMLFKAPDQFFPAGNAARKQMRSVVEPWIRLTSLIQLDAGLYGSFLENCKVVERWIQPDQQRVSKLGWVLMAVLGFAAVGVMVWLVKSMTG
jgi:eukaryotic-like serine/threonine-protein kinase